jgi:hypothetical protein
MPTARATVRAESGLEGLFSPSVGVHPGRSSLRPTGHVSIGRPSVLISRSPAVSANLCGGLA